MDFAKLSGVFSAGGAAPVAPTDAVIRPPQGANYTMGNGSDGPPTETDAHQSVTHHLSSITYNAKHAAAHQAETAKHSQLLLNLLKKVPGFARHAKKV